MSYYGTKPANEPLSADKLAAELKQCVELQATMKEVNAYWRSAGTCVGAPGITEAQAIKLDEKIATTRHSWEKQPFSSYDLTNNNSKIKRLESKVKGTLTIMLTKGLSRPAVVLSKFTAATAIMTVSYWLSYGVTYGYTAYFWPDAALPHLFFSAMCVWLMAVLYLCILMLGCVLFRQAFTAILFLLGVITTISLLGFVDLFAAYSPSILTNKNLDLISGEVAVSDFTIPIIIAIVLSVGLLSLAVVRFNKKQI